MSLYYQDDCVTLYHGDSLEILPTLDIKADVLLTDIVTCMLVGDE